MAWQVLRGLESRKTERNVVKSAAVVKNVILRDCQEARNGERRPGYSRLIVHFSFEIIIA